MNLAIALERSELAILVLHMNVMRKAIKKGFKSKYGQFEGRKMIKIYDELKERFENELTEEIEVNYFDLITDEINMLYSFLNWYVQEYKSLLGDKPNEELELLENVKGKLKGLVEVAAEQILREAL